MQVPITFGFFIFLLFIRSLITYAQRRADSYDPMFYAEGVLDPILHYSYCDIVIVLYSSIVFVSVSTIVGTIVSWKQLDKQHTLQSRSTTSKKMTTLNGNTEQIHKMINELLLIKLRLTWSLTKLLHMGSVTDSALIKILCKTVIRST